MWLMRQWAEWWAVADAEEASAIALLFSWSGVVNLTAKSSTSFTWHSWTSKESTNQQQQQPNPETKTNRNLLQTPAQEVCTLKSHKYQLLYLKLALFLLPTPSNSIQLQHPQVQLHVSQSVLWLQQVSVFFGGDLIALPLLKPVRPSLGYTPSA